MLKVSAQLSAVSSQPAEEALSGQESAVSQNKKD